MEGSYTITHTWGKIIGSGKESFTLVVTDNKPVTVKVDVDYWAKEHDGDWDDKDTDNSVTLSFTNTATGNTYEANSIREDDYSVSLPAGEYSVTASWTKNGVTYTYYGWEKDKDDELTDFITGPIQVPENLKTSDDKGYQYKLDILLAKDNRVYNPKHIEWYINLAGQVLDTQGNVNNHPANQFTKALHSSKYSGTLVNISGDGSPEGVENTSSRIDTALAGVYLEKGPLTDEAVLTQLKESGMSIGVYGGGTFDKGSDISEYQVLWYVLKEYSFWHIDGVVARKGIEYVELPITKTVEGLEALNSLEGYSVYVDVEGANTIISDFTKQTDGSFVGIGTVQAPSTGTYQVSETVTMSDSMQAAFDAGKYEIDDATTSVPGEITMGNGVELKLVNGYKTTAPTVVNDGKLTITKTFEGVPEANWPAVTVNVVGTNNYSETVTLDKDNNWSKTLTGLAAGEYTVKETIIPVVPGYDCLETSYQRAVGSDVLSGGGGVTLGLGAADENNEQHVNSGRVVITNKYEAAGVITVTKSVNGMTDVDGYTVTVVLKNSDGKMIDTAEITASGSHTFTGLVPGVYTITEENVPKTFGNYRWQESGSDTTGTVTLTANSMTGSVYLTNKYVAAGTLEVVKTLAYDADKSNAPTAGESFEVKVQIGTGNTDLGTIDVFAIGEPATAAYTGDGVYTLNMTPVANGANAKLVITGIPAGTAYAVTETLSTTQTNAGYKLEKIADGEGTIAASASGTTIATVANSYFNTQLTTISGEKTWTGGDALPNSIEVTLYQDGTAVDTATANADGNWAYSFGDQPAYDANGKAYSYSVEETGMTYNNDAVRSAVRNGNVWTVYGTKTVAGSDPTQYNVLGVWTATVDETNIENAWTPAENLGSGEFTVLKTDENGKALAGAEFTLSSTSDTSFAAQVKTSDKDGKITFANLPAGTYTLKETNSPDGYQETDETWTITITKDYETLVKVEESTSNIWQNIWGWVSSSNKLVNGVLTVENTPVDYSLTIVKQVTGTATGVPATYAFNVYRADVSGEKTGPALNDQPIKVDVTADVPAGQNAALYGETELTSSQYFWLKSGSYVVEEVAVDEAEHANYTLSTSYSSVYGDDETNPISSAFLLSDLYSEAAAHVLNAYTLKTGDVTFNKADGEGKALAGAGFTLYTDEACNNPYGSEATSDTQGIVTFENLPYGVYYMKETKTPAGYQENDTVYQVVLGEDGAAINEGTPKNGLAKFFNIFTKGTDNNYNTPLADNTVVNTMKTYQVKVGLHTRLFTDTNLTYNPAAETTVELTLQQIKAFVDQSFSDTFAAEIADNQLSFYDRSFESPDNKPMNDTMGNSSYLGLQYNGYEYGLESNGQRDNGGVADPSNSHKVYVNGVAKNQLTEKLVREALLASEDNTLVLDYYFAQVVHLAADYSGADDPNANPASVSQIFTTVTDTALSFAQQPTLADYDLAGWKLNNSENNYTFDPANINGSNYKFLVNGSTALGQATEKTVNGINQLWFDFVAQWERSTDTLLVTKTTNHTLPASFQIQVTQNNEIVAALGLTAAEATETSVAVQAPDTTSGNGTYTWTVTLPTGAYELAESNYQVSGYNVATTINGMPVSEPSTETRVEAGEEAAVAFNNTYTRQMGMLNVTKTSNRALPEGFVFQITKAGDASFGTMTLGLNDLAGSEANPNPTVNGETYTYRWSTEVPVGEYVVEENGYTLGSFTVTTQINGGTPAANNPFAAAIAVSENATAAVEFINTYRTDSNNPPPTPGGGGDDGGDSGDSGTTPGTTPGTDPGVDIIDPQVPLTEYPSSNTGDPEEEYTDIPEGDPILANAPSTGDNIAAWALAAAISGIGLVWLAIAGKKRKDSNAG